MFILCFLKTKQNKRTILNLNHPYGATISLSVTYPSIQETRTSLRGCFLHPTTTDNCKPSCLPVEWDVLGSIIPAPPGFVQEWEWRGRKEMERTENMWF